MLALCLLSAPGFAADEHFDYDSIGRLVRVIDEQGRVTEYEYDPAGNLLRVITDGTIEPPVVAGITPGELRRGESRSFIVVGNGLAGVRVSVAAESGLAPSNVFISNVEARVTLTASATAVLGPQPITFTSSAGSTSVGVLVLEPIAIYATPTPLAIPPDGIERQFVLNLAEPDTVSHSVLLSVKDASIATVTPAVTFAPGQTQVAAGITGLTAGQTEIVATFAGVIDPLEIPLHVTNDYAAINFTYGVPLRVIKGDITSSSESTALGQPTSPPLGIVNGQ